MMMAYTEKINRLSYKLVNNNYSSLLIFFFCLVALGLLLFLFFIVAAIVGTVFYATDSSVLKSLLDGHLASFIGGIPLVASMIALLVSLVGVMIALIQIKSHYAKVVPIIGLLLNIMNVSLFLIIILS
jgi:hypothetical protein